MKSKTTLMILVMILAGILFRLFLTWNGNFLFNMDNARDMVDVREMIVLGKFRLTGPNSAIEGLFNGPFWYYLLAVPFIISGGNPYASIIMEFILWAVGGFFLLKLVSNWGRVLILPIGLLWIASNYIVLTNLYAFNPNPVTLLTPLFIYLLVSYLQKGKAILGILVWLLAGLFFNFEMNIGVFMPLIILASIILTKKFSLLKNNNFWIGVGVFILTLMPQVIFDFKHQFIMSKAIVKFLAESNGSGFNPWKRLPVIWLSFYNTFQATMMNQKLLASAILVLSIPILKKFLSQGKKDITALVSLTFILVPFIGYLIVPVSVNPWHLGGPMAASLIFIGFLLKELISFGITGKLISAILTVSIILFGVGNITNFFLNDMGKPSMDPSIFRNEIAAIDYVYKQSLRAYALKKAGGKNFKVYTYLPSVYDYPYQYLFWWYGKKTYGYIPGEYVYSPNKPKYIPGQESFQGRKENFSGLIFLIKEPDRNYTRAGWEGDFIKYNWETIGKQMVGPLEVEIRKEKTTK